jgi:tetratricopeptide (TPR) repeat protein
MLALKRVVQRRCEQRDCERFGMPVDAGDVCPACKNPLVVKTKWNAWLAMAAGGAVLVLAIPVVLLLRPHPSAPHAVVTLPAPSAVTTPTSAAVTTPASAVVIPPTSPPPQTPQLPAPAQSAVQEAVLAVSRGERLASRGLYENARLEFLRATVADPGSSMAWANLGAAAALTRRVEEARGAYEKALTLAPDNWLTHYNLAVLLAREGDRDGAVRHLERFAALAGPREERRRKAMDDLRRDPALRGFLGDPRVRDLMAQTEGK